MYQIRITAIFLLNRLIDHVVNATISGVNSKKAVPKAGGHSVVKIRGVICGGNATAKANGGDNAKVDAIVKNGTVGGNVSAEAQGPTKVSGEKAK